MLDSAPFETRRGTSSMRYTSVCLNSFGFELPPRVVSSVALEDALAPLYQKLGMPPGRLEMISGVKERRFWEDGTTPSMVSIRTAGQAIERSGIDKNKIGALVHTSVCRDFLEPATASVVAGALDLPQAAMVFDISNACLGFMNGIVVLANMIELGQIEAGDHHEATAAPSSPSAITSVIESRPVASRWPSS